MVTHSVLPQRRRPVRSWLARALGRMAHALARGADDPPCVMAAAAPPPPPPPGWRFAPCYTPGVTSYHVTKLYRHGDRPSYGPGMELGGVNADAFHGFPAGTLCLNVEGIRAVVGERGTEGMRITYRLDYRTEGWTEGVAPLIDFARLPWGE